MIKGKEQIGLQPKLVEVKISEYNSEIAEALKRVRSGRYATHEEVVSMLKTLESK